MLRSAVAALRRNKKTPFVGDATACVVIHVSVVGT
jgi:hypothetical protein